MFFLHVLEPVPGLPGPSTVWMDSFKLHHITHQVNEALSVMAEIYQVTELGFLVVKFIFSSFILRCFKLGLQLI